MNFLSISIADSSYRHVLSTAVLKLQETGKLRDLKRKWWKEKRGGGLCTVIKSTKLYN